MEKVRQDWPGAENPEEEVPGVRFPASGTISPAPPAALPAKPSGPPPLKNLFRIDARPLALFHIAMGLLLADSLVSATDLKTMDLDDGMFSRTVGHHHFTSVRSHQPGTAAPHQCEWHSDQLQASAGIP